MMWFPTPRFLPRLALFLFVGRVITTQHNAAAITLGIASVTMGGPWPW